MSPKPTPTPRIGDRVRELQTDEERYVIDVIDEEVVIVLADESRAKTSNRRRWLVKNCVIVVTCPFHIDDEVTLGNGNGVPGKIVEIKPHYHGKWLMFCVERPQPSGGTMKNWANEGALHLVASTPSVPARVEPVAYDLKATEAAADPDADDPLFRAAQLLADEMDKTIAAEERAKVAELQIKKLEQIIRNHESYAAQPQSAPIAQRECVEATTIWQTLATPEQAKVADSELSTYRTQGWVLIHTMYTADLNKRALMMERTFKISPQPERGTAGAHADLTVDFVREEHRSPFRAPTPADEIPAVGTLVTENAIKLGPIGTSIKEVGVEATAHAMNYFAIQGAIERGKERIDAIPAFNRPLHSLKASN